MKRALYIDEVLVSANGEEVGNFSLGLYGENAIEGLLLEKGETLIGIPLEFISSIGNNDYLELTLNDRTQLSINGRYTEKLRALAHYLQPHITYLNKHNPFHLMNT